VRTTIRVALCALLITGCGMFGSSGRLGDLEAKTDDVAGRMKSLEDRLLALEKKQIQQQQAVQAMYEKVRDMETNFAKLQYGQTVTK
jgi:outer membrane murein-binding lipoprotein Lpp